MHCSTGYYFLYMQGQNFTNFTLIFQLLQSHPSTTHRLFFFNSSLLSSSFLSLFSLNMYHFTVPHPHLLSPHHKDSLSHLCQAERDFIPLSSVCCSFLASLLFILNLETNFTTANSFLTTFEVESLLTVIILNLSQLKRNILIQ